MKRKRSAPIICPNCGNTGRFKILGKAGFMSEILFTQTNLTGKKPVAMVLKQEIDFCDYRLRSLYCVKCRGTIYRGDKIPQIPAYWKQKHGILLNAGKNCSRGGLNG